MRKTKDTDFLAFTFNLQMNSYKIELFHCSQVAKYQKFAV